MLELDICGEILPLADEQVDWLIARASGDAGRSARRRDLAGLLRARTRDASPSARLALRRFEARTLTTLLAERERDLAGNGALGRS